MLTRFAGAPSAARIAGVAGVVGPLWLGGTIAALSVAQYEFMRSLGWHPLDAPTMDWPSGLALGPYGVWLTAAFVGCGALLLPFAATLHRALRPSQRGGYGPALLGAAGVALALLAAPTDPTLAGGPRTAPGLLHDAAFVLLGLTLLPGMTLLGARFRRDPAWRGHAEYTWLTLALAAPAFALKGAAFYVFLVGAMAWFVVTGARLARADGAAVNRPFDG
jgi:hypothetical protein